MLDHWVYQPGIPANVAPARSRGLRRGRRGGRRLRRRRRARQPAWGGWTTDERLRFLNKLAAQAAEGPPRRARPRASASTDTGNMEVRFAWLDLAVANRYDPGGALARAIS